MALESCDYLMKDNLHGNCEKPLVKGYHREAVLMNYEDVLAYTTDAGVTTRGQYSGITRKVGSKGVSILMDMNPFTGTVKSGVQKATGVHSQKTVKFLFNDAGLTADNKVDILQNGQFVIVVKPLHDGSDEQSGYEIIGKESPLVFNATAQDRNSTDNDGAWDVTLQCVEPHTGNYLWLDDKATTEALFQGLKVIVPGA